MLNKFNLYTDFNSESKQKDFANKFALSTAEFMCKLLESNADEHITKHLLKAAEIFVHMDIDKLRTGRVADEIKQFNSLDFSQMVSEDDRDEIEERDGRSLKDMDYKTLLAGVFFEALMLCLQLDNQAKHIIRNMKYEYMSDALRIQFNRLCYIKLKQVYTKLFAEALKRHFPQYVSNTVVYAILSNRADELAKFQMEKCVELVISDLKRYVDM